MPSNKTSNKIACDACHARKIHCDTPEKGEADRPCDWCAHHNTKCTFTRIRGRRKTSSKRANPHDDLATRLSRIEAALASGTFATRVPAPPLQNQPVQQRDPASEPQQPFLYLRPSQSVNPHTNDPSTAISYQEGLIASSPEGSSRISTYLKYADEAQASSTPTSTSSTPFTPSTDTHESYAQIHFAGAHLGHLSSTDGIPQFSSHGQRWIQKRTGEKPSISTIIDSSSRFRRSQSTYSSYRPQANDFLELPDRNIVREHLATYHNSAFRLAFPMVDVVLFEDTIRKAYEEYDGVPFLDVVTSKACIFAFMSLTFTVSGSAHPGAWGDSDRYCAKAQRLLPDLVQLASVTSLQAFFMIFLHQMFSGHYNSATMFHSLASRLVFALGGNRKPVKSSQSNTKSGLSRSAVLVRNIFWMCYAFDKDIALRTGQLPLITDDNCDLTLPDGYEEQVFDLDRLQKYFQGSIESGAMPHVVADLRIHLLKAKTCYLLYSPYSSKKSDADMIKDIRALDAELEAWRQSLPDPFRPQLLDTQNLYKSEHTGLPDAMQRIVIFLEYFSLLATIHRASGRCQARPTGEFQEDDEDLRLYGLTSSMQIGLAASRSTIVFLSTVLGDLAEECFWMIVFYPMSAIITLFCGILSEPLAPAAQADLLLLQSALPLLKSLPNTKMNNDQLIHVRYMSQFSDELARLGQLALQKAQAERDCQYMMEDAL